MPKTRRSAFTKIFQKLVVPRSRKNAKNSKFRGHKNVAINFQVRSHRKMQKMHRSAFIRKFQKLAAPQSQKIPQTRRSTFTEKCQNLAGPQSREMPKTRKSAFTENAENSQIRIHENIPKSRWSAFTKYGNKIPGSQSQKMKKCIGQHLCENGKTRRSAVMEKCQKLAGPRLQNNS